MKHKKIFFILLAILILLIILVLATRKKSPSSTSDSDQNNSGAVDFSALLQENEKNLNPKQAFYLNRVDSLTGVTGFSWLENQLIYSTSKGIYLADGNQILAEIAIDNIFWNARGRAIFKQSNQWYLFDAEDKKVTTVNLAVKIAPDYIWINNKTVAAIQNNQATAINLDDPETIQGEPVSLPAGSQLAGISPEADTFGLFSPETEDLILTDRFGTEKQTINFPESSQLTVSWLDANNFIALSTSKPDSLGRVTDFIWLADTKGAKKFLANSQPIPNKINATIPLFANADKSVIGLVENKNTLWILSLLPDQFPSYYQQSVNFFNPSTKGD